MNAVEQLNAVPFEVYLLLAVCGIVFAVIASALLRFCGLRRLSRYSLHIGIGAGTGFLVLTSPWLIAMITRTWPLFPMWPFWGSQSSGPFTASLLGSIIGIVVGVFICLRRNHASVAQLQDRLHNPTPNLS